MLHKTRSFQQVITQYILDEDNAEQFSEFGAVLEKTGLFNLLAVRGPYTVFVPNNEAMAKYYAELNVNSHEDISLDQLSRLVLNHVVAFQYESSGIGLGALNDTNAIGNYISTELPGSDIIVDKKAKIIDRDVICANGVIHVIDNVLAPVEDDVYTYLSKLDGYSIFTQGLERTGLMDTLQLKSFKYGSGYARTRFTILAVHDTLYQNLGINSIDDLINEYTTESDKITEMENGFYRYMEYHCLAGTYFLNALTTRLYPVLSYDNTISVRIAEDYKINLNSETDEYVGFLLNHSNFSANNGVIHTINDALPVIQPEPMEVTYETTDFFDFEQGDYFKLKQYAKFGPDEGLTRFEKIKWGGNFLQYYYKDHDAFPILGYDALNMNGYWWIEVTFPKVMKGKYALYAYVLTGGDMTDCITYIDGELLDEPFRMRDPAGGAKEVFITNVEWETTSEHSVRFVAINSSTIFWDYVRFEPILD
ncbi:MAG: fasciclin domain-containing protein [Bacteroidales bacterium]|nr:fasciclin domain-containing protein [Bacteroidales bacterium]